MYQQPQVERRGVTIPTVILVILAITACGIGWVVFSKEKDQTTNQKRDRSNHSSSDTGSKENLRHQHPVFIRPGRVPRVDTGLLDREGNSIQVSCSTCHATRQPNNENKSTQDLDEFHVGLTVAHGSISCLSCHNPDDYDALKLADGTRVEFEDVMTLCAQCHGPQTLDFQNGAHGGMNGYWDLSRGPQTRNNCVDCHNPHSPQFPNMMPTFKPRDRFLEKPAASGGGQHD